MELGFFDVVARSVTQLLKSGEFVFNRRKGIIVGSDQDGDDAVVLAHVSNCSFFFCGSHLVLHILDTSYMHAGVLYLGYYVL